MSTKAVGPPTSSTGSPTSPDAHYRESLAAGRVMVQQCTNGHSVFPPRPICPRCHDTALTWLETSGNGTVYSTTTITPRGSSPYAIVLVDAEEGHRLMSRIDGPEALTVQIGDRVSLEARALSEGAEMLPLVTRVDPTSGDVA